MNESISSQIQPFLPHTNKKKKDISRSSFANKPNLMSLITDEFKDLPMKNGIEIYYETGY